MNKLYKIIKKRKIYDGFFKLHEISFIHKKHNGKWSDEIKREIFGGAHVSGVLPYDPIKKKIVLIKQFRPGLLKRKELPIMTEIVAGIIDDKENPHETAKRECKEETGCEIKKLIEIFSYYPAPGSSESYYNLYLGEIESFEGTRNMGQQKENEDILAKSYSIDEIKSLLSNNKIKNGLTLLALQWFFLEYYKN